MPGDAFLRRPAYLLGLLLLCALAGCGRVGEVTPTSRPPQPVRADPSRITLVFVGDILLAGRVHETMTRGGPEAPFVGVSKILRQADLAVGNLECPLSTQGEAEDKTYTFRGQPEAAGALRGAGFDVITLANNHAGDYGRAALLDTVAACRRNHVLTVGAGRSLREARAASYLRVGRPKRTVAVLAFSNMEPTSFYARAGRAGVNPAYLNNIKEDVSTARAQADLVVALFHFGDELAAAPTNTQRLLAHTAVDAGADLVVGHHPHVLQGLELYHGSLIAYSLGNFVFPSHRPETQQTAMLSFTRELRGRSEGQLIPCVITGVKPFVAKKKERAAILARVQKLSGELGTEVKGEGVVRW